MQVTDIESYSVLGPRITQQDELAHAEAFGGAYILAACDGHGKYGDDVAWFTSTMVDKAARTRYESAHEAQFLTTHVGRLLTDVSEILRNKATIDARHSGSTATFAVVQNDRIEVAWLGDSGAYWIPDVGRAIRLVKPHNQHNADEKLRAEQTGAELLFLSQDDLGGYYWYDGEHNYVLNITRSVGDLVLNYVDRSPDYASLDLQSSGILAIATDGVFRDGVMDAETERRIRDGTLDREFIEELAEFNGDNASLQLARIG